MCVVSTRIYLDYSIVHFTHKHSFLCSCAHAHMFGLGVLLQMHICISYIFVYVLDVFASDYTTILGLSDVALCIAFVVVIHE